MNTQTITTTTTVNPHVDLIYVNAKDITVTLDQDFNAFTERLLIIKPDIVTLTETDKFTLIVTGAVFTDTNDPTIDIYFTDNTVHLSIIGDSAVILNPTEKGINANPTTKFSPVNINGEFQDGAIRYTKHDVLTDDTWELVFQHRLIGAAENSNNFAFKLDNLGNMTLGRSFAAFLGRFRDFEFNSGSSNDIKMGFYEKNGSGGDNFHAGFNIIRGDVGFNNKATFNVKFDCVDADNYLFNPIVEFGNATALRNSYGYDFTTSEEATANNRNIYGHKAFLRHTTDSKSVGFSADVANAAENIAIEVINGKSQFEDVIEVHDQAVPTAEVEMSKVYCTTGTFRVINSNGDIISLVKGSPITANTTDTAGVAYTTTEQGIINTLKQQVAELKDQIELIVGV